MDTMKKQPSFRVLFVMLKCLHNTQHCLFNRYNLYKIFLIDYDEILFRDKKL